MQFGLNGIFLKEIKEADVIYGRHQYDYQEGTLIFIAPGQMGALGTDVSPRPIAWYPTGQTDQKL